MKRSRFRWNIEFMVMESKPTFQVSEGFIFHADSTSILYREKKNNHGILHGWQNISISERDRKTREEKHVKLGENCKISWCLTEMCTSLKKNDLSF